MIHCTSVEKDEYLFLPKIFEKKGALFIDFSTLQKVFGTWPKSA